VSSGSRQPASAAAAAKKHRPSGTGVRGRMAAPARKYDHDPLASQAAGNKKGGGAGAVLDVFGLI
jgi:hypothetical protein